MKGSRVRGGGSPNLSSSLRNVFKQTSSRDLSEEDSMGLDDCLKGKGISEKGGTNFHIPVASGIQMEVKCSP